MASAPIVEDSLFLENTSTGGGAMMNGKSSEPVIDRTTFRSNSANKGGAVYSSQSSPSYTNVGFFANRADQSGGGAAYNQGRGGTSLFTNVTFAGNRSQSSWGGAMYNDGHNPALMNVAFVENDANQGGAIFQISFHQEAQERTLLTNVTFAANRAQAGGAIKSLHDSRIEMINAVVWGPGEQLALASNSAEIRHSCLPESVEADISNIELEESPFVEEPAQGMDDVWGTVDDVLPFLKSDSLCVDSGDGSVVPPTVNIDLAGNERFRGTIDRGAYELTESEL